MKPDIESRIAKYEEGQIEFAILGLVRDPMIALTDELAQNVKDVMFLSPQVGHESVTSLGKVLDEPGSQLQLSGDVLLGPSERYGLSQGSIDACNVSERFRELVHIGAKPPIQDTMRQLRAKQAQLRRSILEEVEAREAETRRVTCRQHDFGPLAQKVAEILAKRNMAGLIKESRGKGAKKRK